MLSNLPAGVTDAMIDGSFYCDNCDVPITEDQATDHNGWCTDCAELFGEEDEADDED